MCQESSLNLKPFPASMTTHSTRKHQALAAAMTDLAAVGDMMACLKDKREEKDREERHSLAQTNRVNLCPVHVYQKHKANLTAGWPSIFSGCFRVS